MIKKSSYGELKQRIESLEKQLTTFQLNEASLKESEKLKELFKQRTVTWYVTRRRSKNGQILDVIARGAVFSESEMGVSGELVIFRDITREKRIAKSNGRQPRR